MMSNVSTIADRPATAPTSKGTIPLNLQLSLSDQLYRQAKIDEENRRLKKKSKGEGGSSKKGKKSSKKSDAAAAAAADENEEDLYPTIKVTRGGELPEGAAESGNEDNDQEGTGGKKNKKIDPHRALNIDLEEISAPKTATPPAPVQEPPPPKPTESPAATTKKPKKKKTTTEKEGKPKRERGDYKELLSPTEEIEKPVLPSAAPVSTKSDEKPKKKKTTTTKTKQAKSSDAVLFDMMSDDIQSTTSSTQQYNEQNLYKPVAQSDDLIIVKILSFNSLYCLFFFFFF